VFGKVLFVILQNTPLNSANLAKPSAGGKTRDNFRHTARKIILLQIFYERGTGGTEAFKVALPQRLQKPFLPQRRQKVN
jgi:hypothetical protein